ncbi:hypothetical protein EQ836_24700 [Ectopseudomonas mendocina]|uniref:Uncharacterized protein n=1 Tax=Ectopseudomonas mendocina TaxID=300 RepID=A0ABD7RR30_ECTME|nr:hypothetical protein [Pseudomonas mendocina]TRO08203.1 hypothetical protein EQ829_24690 [Pseudomonas mendocina]TRO10902.1 hypothetical protein EQ836_24700 [Pseudomonas mendocina]
MALDLKKFISVIESAHVKVPLPEFNSKLRDLNLPSSNSWAKVAKALVDYASSAKSKNQQSELEQLIGWVDSYVSYSNKILTIYNLGNCHVPKVSGLADAFETALPALHISSKHPAGSFPAFSQGAQSQNTSGRLFFRGRRKTAHGSEFIFSSFQEYQVREDLPLTQGDAKTLPKLSPYYKLIGLRRVVHEHIDLVRFSHSALAAGVGSVEVLLDGTKPGGAILNVEEALARTKVYTSLVNNVMGKTLGEDLPGARNLFGAMSKIYNSKEGNVCELYFTTKIGGSVKREKMKRNTADLRSETWHAGGRKAIASAAIPDSIDIYRLSVSWKLSFSDDEPVLSILGTYKSLDTGVVYCALVSGCTEDISFEHAFAKLVNYS